MSNSNVCPNCAKPLDDQSPNGLCPACLLMAGVDSTMDHFGDEKTLTENVGTQIGRYKLLEQIGEGGFGVVYMAEQLEPVRRRVALKVIKPGMDSRQIIARFEAERQALAMMDHENIARVLDAGSSETGHPYFVMELVRGLPITEYCDKNKLKPRQRLELMISVCHAIQHAHQKGIIHRDIKPSNVLVTLYDGRPVPKVIDFGVAKAIQQPLTEKTMFTRFGQVMGTLEYMSPEQAEMSGLDIDTRGDIYSLGVLMYELLTGSTPLSRDKLRSAAFDEVLRIIRDEEPPRPSLRLDKSGKERLTISHLRGVAPEKLESILRGELDWIVMKALEKDRSRRYENANDFANDIHRFLSNEPIAAAPPSSFYRIRKLVWKHRPAVFASAAILAVLLTGLFVSLSNYYKATEARNTADRIARKLQEQQKRLVDAFEQAKEEESAKATALKEKDRALKQRTKALMRSQTLRLAAESLQVAEQDPGLALRLASEGLALHRDSIQANLSLLNALSYCHEIKTIFFDDEIRNCEFASNGERAFIQIENRIEVWDIRQGKSICDIEFPRYVYVRRIVPNNNGTQFVVLISGWKSYKSGEQTLYLTDRVARVFDVKAEKEIHVLSGHADRVSSAAFNEDGSLIVTASWDGTARVWDTQSGESIVIADYNEQQSSLDARVQSGVDKHFKTKKSTQISLADAAFNNDGSISVTPMKGRQTSILMFEAIKKINLDKQAQKAGVPAGALNSVLTSDKELMNPRLSAFSKNLESAGGGSGTNVDIFGWQPGEQLFSVEDGSYIRTTDSGKTNLWDNEADKSSRLLRIEKTKNPSRRIPVMARIAGKNIVVERFQRGLLTLKGHRFAVINLAYDATRDHVVSCDRESIRVWKTDSLLTSIRIDGKHPVTCAAIDQAGEFLATGHADGGTCVWSLNNGLLASELKRSYSFIKKATTSHRPDIESIKFDSSGRRLVTRSSENAIIPESFAETPGKAMETDVVRVWDWRSNELLFRLNRRENILDLPRYLGYESASFIDNHWLVTVDNGQHGVSHIDPDGRLTGSYSGDGIRALDKNGKPIGPFLGIRKWNIKSGELEFQIVSDQIATQPRLCRSGKFVAIHIGSQREIVDVKNGVKVGSIPSKFSIGENCLFVTDDGHWAFILSYSVSQETGRFGVLVNTQTRETKEMGLAGCDDIVGTKIKNAAFNREQSELAIALESGHVLVVNMAQHNVRSFLAHSEAVCQVLFSRNGSRLITASRDRFCRVWRADTLKQTLEFGPHKHPLKNVITDPNDRFVLTIPESGEIRQWPLEPNSLIAEIESPFNPTIPRDLTTAEETRFEVNLVREEAVD